MAAGAELHLSGGSGIIQLSCCSAKPLILMLLVV